MRRLIRLCHLDISHNPLIHAHLRFLPELTTLKKIDLTNTNRNKSNTPLSLEKLVNLEELSFAENNLEVIPDCCFTIPNLKKLNLSNNKIRDLPLHIDNWSRSLLILNVSNNQIDSLPNSICRFEKLTHLYLNDNKFDFKGLNLSSWFKVQSLTHFYASFNELDAFPEAILQCQNLKKLILSKK